MISNSPDYTDRGSMIGSMYRRDLSVMTPSLVTPSLMQKSLVNKSYCHNAYRYLMERRAIIFQTQILNFLIQNIRVHEI
jgi:hypothetical protein